MQDPIGGILPVLILFTLVCYPIELAYLSETSLGKLFFVSLILYYGNIDLIYGIFTCVLVLVYYQVGYLDHVRSIERNQLIQESMATWQSMFSEEESYMDPAPTIRAPEFRSYTTRDASTFTYIPHECPSKEDTLLQKDRQHELKTIFRREHCKQGKLQNGVRHELAEHVAFPLTGNRVAEVRFDQDFAKCNPCDPTCGFSIRTEQLNVEEKLSKPASSNMLFLPEWDRIFENVDFRPMESIFDDIHQSYTYFIE